MYALRCRSAGDVVFAHFVAAQGFHFLPDSDPHTHSAGRVFAGRVREFDYVFVIAISAIVQPFLLTSNVLTLHFWPMCRQCVVLL